MYKQLSLTIKLINNFKKIYAQKISMAINEWIFKHMWLFTLVNSLIILITQLLFMFTHSTRTVSHKVLKSNVNKTKMK